VGVHGFAGVRRDGDIEDTHVGVFEQDVMAEGSGGEAVGRVYYGGGLAGETAAGMFELDADGMEWSVAGGFLRDGTIGAGERRRAACCRAAGRA